MEPTERSMPADRITNVIPTATIALMLVCSTTFSRFDTVRKCGVRIQRAAQSAARPIAVPNCRAGKEKWRADRRRTSRIRRCGARGDGHDARRCAAGALTTEVTDTSTGGRGQETQNNLCPPCDPPCPQWLRFFDGGSAFLMTPIPARRSARAPRLRRRRRSRPGCGRDASPGCGRSCRAAPAAPTRS